MNVQPLGVQQNDALLALKEYKQHRSVYDVRDWEIERIYRAISKGKTVISVNDAIRVAGLDQQKRPMLAICQADAIVCRCARNGDHLLFGMRQNNGWMAAAGRIRVEFPNVGHQIDLIAQVPRIPPQHRPAAPTLSKYHILWEADWQAIPRDPYLLKRIGKDAWVVLAAWDLTDVEVSVLRAHQEARH